jgi:hypothetical protein
MRSIDIQIKPSKLFILFLSITLLCCMTIVATLPLSFLNKILLAAAVFAYGWSLLRDWILPHGKRVITRLSYASQGWMLTDREDTYRCELCGDSTLTPFLAILRFKLEGERKKRTCLLFKDIVDPDLYRRLMVTARTAKIH